MDKEEKSWSAVTVGELFSIPSAILLHCFDKKRFYDSILDPGKFSGALPSSLSDIGTRRT
jgi:hypothetical protein